MEIIYFDPAQDPKLVFKIYGDGKPAGGTYSWAVGDAHVIDFSAQEQRTHQLPELRVKAEGQTTITQTYTLPNVGAAVDTVIIKTVPVTLFDDVRFADAAESVAIGSFLKRQPLRMSRNFYKALCALGTCIEIRGERPRWRALYAKVVTAVNRYFADGLTAGLDHLATFIFYNVHKTGAHLVSGDEAQWSMQLAGEFIPVVPKPDADLQHRTNLATAFLDHYMCEVRYSARVPAFLRKGLPQFVYDALRAHDTGQQCGLFEMSNGLSLAHAKTMTEQAARGTYAQQLQANQAGKLEIIKFDPAAFMLATVQVPVMSGPLTLPVRTVDRVLGKTPDAMGYQMTQEFAGACRRSLNSQRVIEIAERDDTGKLVLLQLKGSGVPEYGFDVNNAQGQQFGTFTGGEFFKLTAERGAMGLRDFGIAAFAEPSIAPDMAGMALVASKGKAYAGGMRTGAISFRLDYSGGMRFPNPEFAADRPAPLKARAQALLPDLPLGSEAAFHTHAFDAIVRHYVMANLFGMNYDDSTLKDLGDIGLQGEFSDSGTLRNLTARIDTVKATVLVNNGLRSIGKNEVFAAAYLQQMGVALRALGAKAGAQQNRTDLLRIADSIATAAVVDPDGTLLLMETYCAKLGAELNVTSRCQQEFYDAGLNAYIAVMLPQLILEEQLLLQGPGNAIWDCVILLKNNLDNAQWRQQITVAHGLLDGQARRNAVLCASCAAAQLALPALRRWAGTKQLSLSDAAIASSVDERFGPDSVHAGKQNLEQLKNNAKESERRVRDNALNAVVPFLDALRVRAVQQ